MGNIVDILGISWDIHGAYRENMDNMVGKDDIILLHNRIV
jgi:hypothetical protein